MAPPLSLRFILVRPSNALNIGAVARAMRNFGLDDLAAVSPSDPRWRAAQSAIYGAELLERAPVGTLKEMTADCNLVLGTASAHNRAHRLTCITLPALRPWIKRRLPKGGRAAIVLGSERNGLDNEELSHCHALVRIPTSPDAPSMNLGQAAALIAYEMGKLELERSATTPQEPLLDCLQMDSLERAAIAAMKQAGVHTHMSEALRVRKLRRGLFRWRMTRGDASWLQDLLERLTTGNRRKKKTR